MNKIIKFVLATILTIGLFVVATLFHKTELAHVGVLSGTTEVLQVTNKAIFTYYLVFIIMASLSAALSRYKKHEILLAIISWALAFVRMTAGFAMISGGASIYVAEKKIEAFAQLLVPILMIIWQFMLKPSKKRRNTHQATSNQGSPNGGGY